MRRVKRLKDEQLYVELTNIIRIGNSAIKQGKRETRGNGQTYNEQTRQSKICQ